MVARQSGPMKRTTLADCTRTLHECGRQNGVTCKDYSSRIPLFFREFIRYLMQHTPRRRQGRESSWPESLSEVYGRSRNRTRGAVVQKRSVVWKSRQDSVTVDSAWYGLFFNLAQFTLHLSGTFWDACEALVCACQCLTGGGELVFAILCVSL